MHDGTDILVVAQTMLPADCEQAPGEIEDRRQIAPKLIHHHGPPECMADTRHMSEGFGDDYAFARLHDGLIRIPKKPEHQRPLALAAYGRIMAAVDQRVRAMLLGVVERQAFQHMLVAADVTRRGDIGRPAGMVRFTKKFAIAKSFRHPEQLVGELTTG